MLYQDEQGINVIDVPLSLVQTFSNQPSAIVVPGWTGHLGKRIRKTMLGRNCISWYCIMYFILSTILYITNIPSKLGLIFYFTSLLAAFFFFPYCFLISLPVSSVCLLNNKRNLLPSKVSKWITRQSNIFAVFRSSISMSKWPLLS